MELQELLKSNDFNEIEKQLKIRPEFAATKEDAENQYDVTKHKVFSITERPDKTVKRPDPSGEKNNDGTDVMIDSIEKVTRVGLAYQELITDRSVGFMLGNPIEIEKKYFKENEQGKRLFSMIEKVWSDNKFDMILPEIAERLFSEMEVALIFYFIEEEGYWGDMSKSKSRLKVKICSPQLGDALYPHYDESGDMDAFCRGYSTIREGKTVEHFDIYTSSAIYKWEKESDKWELIRPNDMIEFSVSSPEKIMAVYIKQDAPDWLKAQNLIERLEMSMSNHGDTNDYNGSPILFTKGELQGAPAKGSRGKVLSGSVDSSAQYLAWDNAPGSIKLEFENLKSAIFEITQTPDISFSNLQGSGLPTSGVALKLLFIDAHMKALKNWRTFGTGVQRMLNVVKACICRVVDISLIKEDANLIVTPVCTPYLPQNKQEIAQMVDNSVAAGSISKRTAYENHPLVSDADLEEERAQKEQMESIEPPAE